MKSILIHLYLTFQLILLSPLLLAQDQPDLPIEAIAAVQEAATPASEPSATPADETRVAILGYHEFSETGPCTEMRLDANTFRKQLQAIKDNGIKVISLEDFIAWKAGTKSIPERSILITIDDGWKSVYAVAYPLLKEFGYPFTLFLYTNYVDGGGKALSSEMIKDMLANGASIGSHSASHPLPSVVKRKQLSGAEVYQQYLQSEIGGSKKFLEEKFGKTITTYAYPGGYNTPAMHQVGHEHGYKYFFTVLPAKVSKDTPNDKLPRYIILGTHLVSFDQATSFPATSNASALLSAIPKTTPHPVSPQAAAIISERLPLINADLSGISDLDPASLTMRVSSFGQVPAKFDADSKQFAWKVNRPLRTPLCDVIVTWNSTTPGSKPVSMPWTFIIDRNANYQPRTATTLPTPPAIDEEPTIESDNKSE